MNRVTLSGRLVADPTIGFAGETPLAEFRIANNRGAGGEAEFFSVTAFGPLAELIGQRAQKGQEVAIDGRLRHQTWTDDNEKPRSALDIVATSIVFGAHAKGQDNDPVSWDAGVVANDKVPV